VSLNTSGVNGAVQGYTISQSTGALTSFGTIATGVDPRGLAVDPTGQFLYVVNLTSGTVSGYSINPATGVLASLGAAVGAGTNPIAVAVDPSGRFVYVTNYGDDNVQRYTINALTGVLGNNGTIAAGNGPFSVATDLRGRFVYTANALDSISAYTMDDTDGTLTPAGTFPSGFGSAPAWATVDPSGSFLYVVNNGTASVSVYTINSGTGAPTFGSSAATGLSPYSFVLKMRLQ
jgi:6-phosphogluconolactonase (cycloisomerase 2 family)